MVEHLTTFGGQLAWPVAAVVITLLLLRELKAGLIGKILPPGGSISHGEWKISREVSQQLEVAQEQVQSAHVAAEDPPYLASLDDARGDSLTPYEIVMTSYSGLASAIAELAALHGGYSDQRQVWSNIDLLLKEHIISEAVYGAIRSAQQVRNSIRRLGPESVAKDQARSFAGTAYSLEQELRRKLQA